MRVVGLMSGTSYDGIDVAVADLELADRVVRLNPIGSAEYPLGEELRALIAAALPPARVPMADVCRLDTLLGQAFGRAAADGIADLADGRADLVCSHGQTLFHWVEDGRARGSLQLGNPAWIAERTGLPVISDLRARDIARGGQGAPLVPIFDTLLLPPGPTPRAALNIGGIANLTLIPSLGRTETPDLEGVSGGLRAYDIGPGNALIDLAARRFLGQAYDRDGATAASGTVDESLLATLLAEPYYARTPPKSTGKELFDLDYLDRALATRSATGPSLRPPLGPADVLVTLTELTARIVVTDLTSHGVREVVVSGGGIRNVELLRRLRALLGSRVVVRPIDDFGIPSDAKEAYAFALLGFLSLSGLPGSVPSCTGASAPAVLGSVTPGAAPLRLPQSDGPVVRAPERLVVGAREDRGHDRSDDRSGDGAHRNGAGHPTRGRPDGVA